MTKKLRTFLTLLVSLFIVNSLIWTDVWELIQNEEVVEVSFLNVGQGSSILVKTPNNKYGLIDAGKGQAVLNELVETIPSSIRELEFVILSHPDADHIEGFIEILRRYNIKNVFLVRTHKENELIRVLENSVTKKKISNFELNDSTDFTLDDVHFDVIWPHNEINPYQIDNVNNASISLLISYKNFDILTMGDLASEFELKALKNLPQDKSIEIMTASHHGSNSSSSYEVVTKANPKITVIQSGESNSYGHPHPEVIQNFEDSGTEIYRNDTQGRITIQLGKEMYAAKLMCDFCTPSRIMF